MNQASTRSHCIFTIHLCSREPGSATLRCSKLHLVDLAGSERVAKTGMGGQLLTEAKYINLSLHYLEQVGHLLPFVSTVTLEAGFHGTLRSQRVCAILDSSGDHRAVGEESLAHPLPELHDDVSPEGQPWWQLYDHHDSHSVCGQEEC